MRVSVEKVYSELPIDVVQLKKKFGLNDSLDFLNKILNVAFNNLEVSHEICLRKKIWRVVHNNVFINLSQNPVMQILSMRNSKGEDIKPLNITRMNERVLLEFPEDLGVITVRYESGYSVDSLPECLKSLIVDEFWDLYSKNEIMQDEAIKNNNFANDYINFIKRSSI